MRKRSVRFFGYKSFNLQIAVRVTVPVLLNTTRRRSAVRSIAYALHVNAFTLKSAEPGMNQRQRSDSRQ